MKSKVIGFSFFVLLLAGQAFAINIYLYSPSQYTTINQYQSLTFNIGADDPVGLNFAEWYLRLNGGSTVFQANHDMSSYYDEDSWSYTFNVAGVHNVYAYAYNTNGQNAMCWWQITVNAVLPDLIIQNPIAPTSSLPGSSISVSCRVRNQGNGSATSSRVGYYLATSPNGTNTFLNYNQVSTLSAGTNSDVSRSVTIPSGTAPGNYYITYFADYQNVVTESNHNNNLSSSPITINPLLPDLIVQNPSAPTNACPGQSISVSCVARNQGIGSSSACRMGYYFSATQYGHNSAERQSTTNVPVLAVNGTSNQSTTFLIPANTTPGTYYVNFFVDDQDVVPESYDDNNINLSQVIVRPLPTAQILSPTQFTSVSRGSEVIFSVNGNDPNGLDYVEWYLGSAFQVNHNLSGTQDNDTWSYTFNTVGTYNVYAYVYNIYNGSDFVWWEITVTIQPDLIVQSPSAPAEVCPGQSISVSCVARNQGSGSSGTCRMGYYLSATQYSHNASELIASTNIPALVANGTSSQTTTFPIPANTVPGTYYLNFFADDQAVVVESNDDNNINFAQVEILASPTVYIYSPSQYTTAYSGQTLTFNIGADHPQGLQFCEWYLGATFLENHPMSGYYHTDSLFYQFNTVGTFDVYAYVYSINGCQAFVWWEVNVTAPPPAIEEFFDDFSYSGALDPSLSCQGWNLVVSAAGPGIAPFCISNIAFTIDAENPTNTLLECRTNIDAETMTSSRIETSQYLFLGGTYAARVWFDDSPSNESHLDGTAQTFYTYYGGTGDTHSECDFEYYPYYFWETTNSHKQMDIVTWEAAIANDHWRSFTPRQGSYQGWHKLLFSAVDGVHVRYYIFDDNGNLLGTSIIHSTASDGTGSVYPDHLMNLSISNWIGLRAASNELRTSSFKVDWVYYSRDIEMTMQRVQTIVNQFRSQAVPRRNNLTVVPATLCSFMINNGAESTANSIVTLNNTASYGPTDFMASENEDFSGGVWLPYSSSPSLQLSDGYGVKTVYLKVRNSSGSSEVLSDQIEYNTPPDPVNDLTIILDPNGLALTLNWSPIQNATLYRVHAGNSPGFVPSSANLIGSTQSTTFTDLTSIGVYTQRFYVVVVER